MTYYSGYVPNPTIAPPSNVNNNPTPIVVPGLVYDGVTDNLPNISSTLATYGAAYIPRGKGDIAISAPLFIDFGQAVIMEGNYNTNLVWPGTPPVSYFTPTKIVATSNFSSAMSVAQQAKWPGLSTVNTYARSNAPILNVTWVDNGDGTSTVTVTSGALAVVGQTISLSNIQGATGLTGSWPVSAVGAGTLSFIFTGLPGGAYTRNGIISALNPDSNVPALVCLVGDDATFNGYTAVRGTDHISNLYIAAQSCEITSMHTSRFNGVAVLDTAINAADGTTSNGQHIFNELTIRCNGTGGGANAYSCCIDIQTFDWVGNTIRCTGGSKIFAGGGSMFGVGHLTGAGNNFGFNLGIGGNTKMGLLYMDSGTVPDLVRHWSTGNFSSTFDNCNWINNGGTAGMNMVNQQSTTAGVVLRTMGFGSSSQTFGAIIANATRFDDVASVIAPAGYFATVTQAGLFPQGLPGRVGEITIAGNTIVYDNHMRVTPWREFTAFTVTTSLTAGQASGTTLNVTGDVPAMFVGDQFTIADGSGHNLTVTVNANSAKGAATLTITSVTVTAGWVTGAGTYTVNVYLWTPPSATQNVRVVSVGGGGGGGGSGTGAAVTVVQSGGGGGGAGQTHDDSVPYTSGAITVTIGNGGAGGTAVASGGTNGNSGSQGGSTTISGTGISITVTGAAGGAASTAGQTAASQAGRYGGSGTTGTNGIPGSGGPSGASGNGVQGNPGFGKTSGGGAGGGSAINAGNGGSGGAGGAPSAAASAGNSGGGSASGVGTAGGNATATSYGAGGGGAGGHNALVATAPNGPAGGNGAPGYVSIRAYGAPN